MYMNVPKDIVIDQCQKKDVHTGLPDLATRPGKAPEHRKEGSASSSNSRGALPKRAGIP